MHLIVGIADVAASTLEQWESAHFEGNPPFQSKFSRKSESGTVRLIRTACKALSKHGNEQCGRWRQWSFFQTIGQPPGLLQNLLMKLNGFYSKHELQLRSSRDFTRTEGNRSLRTVHTFSVPKNRLCKQLVRR